MCVCNSLQSFLLCIQSLVYKKEGAGSFCAQMKKIMWKWCKLILVQQVLQPKSLIKNISSTWYYFTYHHSYLSENIYMIVRQFFQFLLSLIISMMSLQQHFLLPHCWKIHREKGLVEMLKYLVETSSNSSSLIIGKSCHCCKVEKESLEW